MPRRGTRPGPEEFRASLDRLGGPLVFIARGAKSRWVRSRGLFGRRFYLRAQREEAGLFVGFATAPRGLPGTSVEPPEAVVFAYVRPVGGRLHDHLVAPGKGALWKAARRATREHLALGFHPRREACLVAHRTVRGMPPGLVEYVASDFFLHVFRVFFEVNFLQDLAKRVVEVTSRPQR